MARNGHTSTQTSSQAIEKSSANQVAMPEAQRPLASDQTTSWTFTPSIDVLDTGSEWVIHADVPGADPQQINITCEDRVLTIHAPVQVRWPQQASMRRCEYNIGDYRRTFRLGEDINAETIEAHFEGGVLTLHLPKAAHAQPKRIPIKTS